MTTVWFRRGDGMTWNVDEGPMAERLRKEGFTEIPDPTPPPAPPEESHTGGGESETGAAGQTQETGETGEDGQTAAVAEDGVSDAESNDGGPDHAGAPDDRGPRRRKPGLHG